MKLLLLFVGLIIIFGLITFIKAVIAAPTYPDDYDLPHKVF